MFYLSRLAARAIFILFEIFMPYVPVGDLIAILREGASLLFLSVKMGIILIMVILKQK